MPRPNRKMELLKLLPPAEAATWPKTRLGKWGTIADLSRRMKLTAMPIGRYLVQLYDEGLAHIGRWNRTRKAPAAVWVQGPGKHAPRPEALPKEVHRKRYHRNRANAIQRGRAGQAYDQRYSKHVARAIADDTAKRTTVEPVTWMSALGA